MPNKGIRFGAAAAAVLLVLSGIAAAGVASADPGDDASLEGHGASDAWVKKQLRTMSLEEKVGQLFTTFAYGETADTDKPDDVKRNQDLHGVDNAAELIETYNIGGIIYFGWSDNLNDPQQIAELSNGMQDVAVDRRGDVPLLVSTDQEHGTVVRLGPPATQFPGNMALGATGSSDDAYNAGLIAGRELRAVGINEDFAPVADVNVNPANPVIGVRSFSSDPQLAAELTGAAVQGYQAPSNAWMPCWVGNCQSVSSTAKHFPGHGNTDTDSHTDLPTIPHTYEEWQTVDAPPFQSAIESGIDSIMTAHIQFPALDDSGDPATLSKPIMTDLLRGELGYDGVVVTDSLRMEGVRQMYPDEEIPVRALQAGVDLMLMPFDIDVAYNAVLDAVASGELTEERIDESVTRILRLKFDRGIVADPFVDPDAIDDVVGVPEHLEVAQDIADRSTTLVQNNGMLPLSADSGSALVTGWGETSPKTLADGLTARGVDAEALSTGDDPDQEAIDAAVAAAEDKDLVVLTVNNARDDEGQLALAEALREAGKPVAVVALNQPYDVAHMTEVDSYLAAYSYGGAALEAVVRTLFAEVNPSGKLPVTIPTADDPDVPLYEIGHGLSYE